MDMRRALKDKLARYKIPQEMRVVKDGLPRNAMGKGKHYLTPPPFHASPPSALFYYRFLSPIASNIADPWLHTVNKKALARDIFGDGS